MPPSQSPYWRRVVLGLIYKTLECFQSIFKKLCLLLRVPQDTPPTLSALIFHTSLKVIDEAGQRPDLRLVEVKIIPIVIANFNERVNDVHDRENCTYSLHGGRAEFGQS